MQRKIETERLILRPFVLGDAEAMFKNWAADGEVTKYLTWPPHDSVETSREIVGEWLAQYEKEDFFQWCIELREIGEAIGSMCATPRGLGGAREIGYCIGRRWWHRGLMSEALVAFMDYQFNVAGVNRVEARHDPNNPRSGMVMKQCGLLYEGRRKLADRNNTGLCDEVLYGLTREDYIKQRQ